MATYVEGGITYENKNGTIYKNGVAVSAANLKYIPTAVGGTRVDTSTASKPTVTPTPTTTTKPIVTTPTPMSGVTTNTPPTSGSTIAVQPKVSTPIAGVTGTPITGTGNVTLPKVAGQMSLEPVGVPPTATAPKQNTDTLRTAAEAAGFKVGFVNGQVTVSDPKTGKQLAFNKNDGSQYGIGNAVNGQHTMADSAKFLASMKAPVSTGTSATGTQANNNLRTAAESAGYKVGFVNGQVTITDPKTGKQIAFNKNEGEQFGIGDAVNGQHTIADSAKFAESMKNPEVVAKDAVDLAEAEGVDLNDPDQLTEYMAQFVKDNFLISSEQSLAEANEYFQDLLEVFGMDTSAVPVPDIMTFGQAKDQATEMFDPLYDEQKERLQKSMQESAVRSGFAGQMPWQMFEAENQNALERQRSSDIANTANSLVGQSRDQANTAMSQAASKRQELFNLFNSAFSASQGAKTGKFDILKNWMDTLGQAKTTQLTNEKTQKELDAYETYEIPILDAKMREALTKAEIAVIDRDLKNAELSVADQTQRLKLQEIRTRIANANNADARDAAYQEYKILAAEAGLRLDGIGIEKGENEIQTREYDTAVADLLDRIKMGSTDGTGVFTPQYGYEDLKKIISGYAGLDVAQRDKLLAMIPSNRNINSYR